MIPIIAIPEGFRGKPKYKLLGERRRKRRHIHGRGFLDVLKRIWSFANPILKATKLGSTLASKIPVIGPTAGTLLKSVGYGKKHKRRTRGHKRGGYAGIIV